MALSCWMNCSMTRPPPTTPVAKCRKELSSKTIAIALVDVDEDLRTSGKGGKAASPTEVSEVEESERDDE